MGHSGYLPQPLPPIRAATRPGLNSAWMSYSSFLHRPLSTGVLPSPLLSLKPLVDPAPAVGERSAPVIYHVSSAKQAVAPCQPMLQPEQLQGMKESRWLIEAWYL